MFVEIIHSARPTGAPRVGLEVAFELHERLHDFMLVSQEAGHILLSAEKRGIRTLVAEEPASKITFPERVAACREVLQGLNCTTAYVNSLAASSWAAAAKLIGAKVVLHAHELDEDLKQLLRSGATCSDICASADTLIVAADSVVGGLRRTLGYVPPDVIDIGVFADPVEVRQNAVSTVFPQWRFGKPFIPSSRKVVGMCGTACHRKGIDHFIRLADRLPQFDFLWVGEWTPDATQTARQAGLEDAVPENFYFSGFLDKPWPLVNNFDLFVLTSREDPNPIVVLEAMALGKPVLCFTETGDSWRIGGQGLYAIHGKPNEDLFCAAITTLMNEAALPATVLPSALTRSEVLSRLSDELGRRGLINRNEVAARPG